MYTTGGHDRAFNCFAQGPERNHDFYDRNHNGDRSRTEHHDRSPTPSSDSSRRSSPSPVKSERFCYPRTFGPNDVEIVVVSQPHDRSDVLADRRDYAEAIMSRLSDCQMTADILYLNENVTLDDAVSEFGRRGTRYVMSVMLRQQETRAVTIWVFEGPNRPVHEYRDMDVDETIDFMRRHFHQHYPGLFRLREAEMQGETFYPTAPPEVLRVLTRVTKKSAVPTSGIDAAIEYFRLLREKTAEFESQKTNLVGTIAPVVAKAAPPDSRNLDHQDRNGHAPPVPAESRSGDVREALLGLLQAFGGNTAAPANQAEPSSSTSYNSSSEPVSKSSSIQRPAFSSYDYASSTQTTRPSASAFPPIPTTQYPTPHFLDRLANTTSSNSLPGSFPSSFSQNPSKLVAFPAGHPYYVPFNPAAAAARWAAQNIRNNPQDLLNRMRRQNRLRGQASTASTAPKAAGKSSQPASRFRPAVLRDIPLT